MEATVRSKLDAAWRDPAGGVKEWKAAGRGKAIGLILTDVPFELVHAAGALPVAVLAREVPFRQVDRKLQGFACSYSRGLTELALTGELDYLDGLIAPYACDTTRCLDLILKFDGRFKFLDCLRLPKRNSAAGVEKYYPAELKRLAAALGAFTGQNVDDQRLRASIAAYNQVRSKLQGLRLAANEGRIDPALYFSAVKAAMVLPPDQSAPRLDEALREPRGAAAPTNGKPRVVVAGKLPEPDGIIDAIAAAGLRIVEDHLVVGSRWATADVDEQGDPWAALTERQRGLMPFAGLWDGRPHRASYLIERVKATRADGAVFLIQKFCELAELDYPGIKEEMEKAGIKLLALETDFSPATLETIKTRLEAFAELLAGGK